MTRTPAAPLNDLALFVLAAFMLSALSTVKANFFYSGRTDPDRVAVTYLNDQGTCFARVRTPGAWWPNTRTALPLACSRIPPFRTTLGLTAAPPLRPAQSRALLTAQNGLPVLYLKDQGNCFALPKTPGAWRAAARTPSLIDCAAMPQDAPDPYLP